MTTSTPPAIQPLAPTQLDQVAKSVGRAFYTDPLLPYITPDPERRHNASYWMNYVFLRYGLLYGEVYTTPNAAGASVWLRPGETEVPPIHMLRAGVFSMLFRLGPVEFARYFGVGDKLEHWHKLLISRPHWYLMLLGVDPDQQGKGIGSALIRAGTSQADAQNVPCYLETLNERNLAIYQKHGFQVIHQDTLAKNGPVFWVMVREPHH